MREIRFRGKDILVGKWVYGDLLHVGDSCAIVTSCNEKEFKINALSARLNALTERLEIRVEDIAGVTRETVGQFTGLFDKNGMEIYEGDIYRYDNPDSINEVSYCAGGGFAGFDLTPAKHSENRLLDVEVIGNIHDNPELLKK